VHRPARRHARHGIARAGMGARGADLRHDRVLAGARAQDQRRPSGVERGERQRNAVRDRRAGRRLGRECPARLLAQRGTPGEERRGVSIGSHPE
jgi:hypothetical protein